MSWWRQSLSHFGGDKVCQLSELQALSRFVAFRNGLVFAEQFVKNVSNKTNQNQDQEKSRPAKNKIFKMCNPDLCNPES